MKKKLLIVTFLLASVVMLFNVSILDKGNSNLTITINSLQKAMADDEHGCGLACYNKRTIIIGSGSTNERFKNNCETCDATIWEDETTCCRD